MKILDDIKQQVEKEMLKFDPRLAQKKYLKMTESIKDLFLKAVVSEKQSIKAVLLIFIILGCQFNRYQLLIGQGNLGRIQKEEIEEEEEQQRRIRLEKRKSTSQAMFIQNIERLQQDQEIFYGNKILCLIEFEFNTLLQDGPSHLNNKLYNYIQSKQFSHNNFTLFLISCQLRDCKTKIINYVVTINNKKLARNQRNLKIMKFNCICINNHQPVVLIIADQTEM
ncbi:unnamed protein product (macronuclear) [Paramecium tetraurelia]|uniref:Transmembrane protein n=1 Tax=Paramecium tetraurelia TaxID=5888 RepID=A0D849_PARTE|nr:uncharacterized protein GSPATT00014183001 [Paramecium tetraurelia]CAK79216.1 unnamed protein product [Paramecium tetraurelia]|eukprot:XP_001446613.1 hypothetical protein (macronuclear) [Paramecium tetraurelia strain d4-2]